MKKVLALLIGGAAVSIGLLGNVAFVAPSGQSTSPVGGGLGFCNRSNRGRVSVAVAYPIDKNTWKTEGWLSLEEKECNTILPGELTNRYYYFLAESDSGYAWKGTHKFCVSDTSFVFLQSDKTCQGANVRWAGFRELDTGKKVQNLLLNLE